MSKLLALGLVAGFVVAACSSSHDQLLDDGGRSGATGDTVGAGGSVCDGGPHAVQNGVLVCLGSDGGAGSGGGGIAGSSGTAGSGGSVAGSGGGGAGGARACASAQCARPYECKLTCDGPIQHSGCCACEAPYFDDFLGRACGGGGAGGSGGAAAGGRGGGAAGTGGAAGGGGSARGGSGGSVAGSGGSAGSSSRGGAGGACNNSYVGLCARPYECIATCGGPLVSNDCCPCQAPLFDNFGDVACRNMGTPALTYVGCRYGGGNNRLVVSKKDAGRNLCVNVVFANPGPAPSGLTLWSSGFGVESVSAGPAAACPTRAVLPRSGGSVTGTVTAPPSTTTPPASVSFNLNVQIPSGDAGPGLNETLSATNVDTAGGCL